MVTYVSCFFFFKFPISMLNNSLDTNGKKNKCYSNNFVNKCVCYVYLKKAGDLIYCKSRSTTECCFSNHSCVDWGEVNRKFGKDTAAVYLTDKVSASFLIHFFCVQCPFHYT